ncbi:nuclear transport factor 2 family protein [Mycolicibacterium rutilum]|nr:nuclear transport factor 2 family protein [Mycolicibacterium rutilum]
MSRSDLEQLSQRYFAAWAARDPDAIAALHTDDTRFWTHTGTTPAVGRQAARDAFATIFEQFPDFSFEIYRVLYGDDHWVLDWALINGSVRFDCLDLVTVTADGLVARKDSFIDSAQLTATVNGAGA